MSRRTITWNSRKLLQARNWLLQGKARHNKVKFFQIGIGASVHDLRGDYQLSHMTSNGSLVSTWQYNSYPTNAFR